MPNHIKNRLELKGSEQQINDCLETIKNDELGFGIDFNKIVPMPKGLELQVSMHIVDAAKVAMKIPVRFAQDVDPKTFDEQGWSDFVQCLQNIKNFGYAYWYDWTVEHWGTKWNAYGQERELNTPNTIMFETAWSNVNDIIVNLSKTFPEIEFVYSFSDEDTGSNAGIGIIKNGASSVTFYESQSKEAYELAFELRPDRKDDYKFIDGKYRYTEED